MEECFADRSNIFVIINIRNEAVAAYPYVYGVSLNWKLCYCELYNNLNLFVFLLEVHILTINII